MRQSTFKIRIKRRRKRRVGRPKTITLNKLFGRGISRPYKYKNRLMLGSGKKTVAQRGGFLPFAPMITAAPAIIDLLGKIIK